MGVRQACPIGLYSLRQRKLNLPGLRVTDCTFSRVPRTEHEHEWPFIAVLLGGAFEKHLRRLSFPVAAAGAFTMPGQVRHVDAIPVGEARMIVLELDPESERWELCGGVLGRVRRLRDGEVATLGARIALELHGGDDLVPLVVEGLGLELLAVAARDFHHSSRRPAAPRWLAAVDEFLASNFTRSPSLSEVAAIRAPRPDVPPPSRRVGRPSRPPASARVGGRAAREDRLAARGGGRPGRVLAPEPLLPLVQATHRLDAGALPAAAPEVTLVLDWDGTVTEEDTLVMALLEFGDPAVYDSTEAALDVGAMTFRQVMEAEMATIRAPVVEVSAWLLEHARLRPRFGEIVARYPSLVVSSGFHELIEPLLAREGIDVPVRANRLVEGADGWRVAWRDEALCEVCGDSCKRGSLPAGEVVYVGDGYSDYCAALAADRVFARDGLARFLEERGIPYEPFVGFPELARALELA
jgi:2-hydroxy-3-keto-5-methylthiopentenyl-1-phosphate phosphatase